MTATSCQRIIFFDGVCGLCNRFVDRLLRADRDHLFKFAPLQGRTAQEVLPAGMADAMKSIVYLRDGVVIQRSDAALWILIDLGGWRALHRGWFVVPRFLRDAVYDWIARNRYRWFGEHDVCRIPTGAERDLFLP